MTNIFSISLLKILYEVLHESRVNSVHNSTSHSINLKWSGVLVVTEASAAVCDEKSRDGFIRTRLASRELMPTLESKCDFHL